MFTGIVEEIGSVRKIVRGRLSVRLTIGCSKILEDVKTGDSIAVNGICLTVVDSAASWFTADVMPETMRRTALYELSVAGRVNLERAMKLSDRLGGHIVPGHIDGIGIIKSIEEEDNAVWLAVEADENILKYIVHKGSVALDGTSLTVADLDEKGFRVSLIPHTAKSTILGFAKTGDKINIECDIVGKYVERLQNCNVPNLHDFKKDKDFSLDFLKSNGFA
ncbi:riboflavin synthase alpha chain [Ruminiclostridium sufflavum DSM 19573]|uniref:Riboflavin synthase n=1 Tax=Ruminiclostridium sufflavum DSM 19573 TaxID=1121337 RepID=A0A318XU31_9FIRM|nr:riboflavin synthase [Ruminiclostridium sufflavum]PYG90353.1 riboflavin synthase alpha chain [Ruminiclostridium sufflavum DSM 19573]